LVLNCVRASNTAISREYLDSAGSANNTNTAGDRAGQSSPVRDLAINRTRAERAGLFLVVGGLIVATADIRSTLKEFLLAESLDIRIRSTA
jgi:hypothetical protein